MSVSKPELSELEPEVLQGPEPSLQHKLLEAFQQSSRRVTSLEEKLRLAELENRYLRELLRRQRLAKYGPGSEKLSDAQLALLELEPGVQQAEVEAESLRPPLELTPCKPRKAAAHPGRQALPAHLPRVERIIPKGLVSDRVIIDAVVKLLIHAPASLRPLPPKEKPSVVWDRPKGAASGLHRRSFSAQNLGFRQQ